jgi:hypothetical protein
MKPYTGCSKQNMYDLMGKKSKAIRLTAVKAYRNLRCHASIFSRQSAHRFGLSCHPYEPADLYLLETFFLLLVLISVRG